MLLWKPCPRYFEGTALELPERACLALFHSLPLVYSSHRDHQKQDPFCVDLRARIQAGQGGADNFQFFKGLLSYYPPQARRL
jgi:hypothetical protein